MMTGFSSLMGTRTFFFSGAVAEAVPRVSAGVGDAAVCGTAGAEVITEWQFPIGGLVALAVWSGSAGAGVGVGVVCFAKAAGFCALWSVSAWLVTSGAVTNK